MNFTALQNSALLQSLGWAIANSFWQAAALWIVYYLVNGVYRDTSPKFKNNFSTILLSSAFIWFCFTLFHKYFATQILSDSYIQSSAKWVTTTHNLNWNDLIMNITSVLPYLSLAYLLLLIFLSIRLINIYRFTSFIKNNGLKKPAVEWKLFTEKVSRHMGITKNIRLWVSDHIDVPATIGFIKPVILIPLASLNQLSTEQLEAIILHELSHIKRNDYLINLFISIIETLLFFNPFVVLLAAIIKRERENCCDDLVIQYQYDRYAYASALLSLEQFRNINFRLAIGATSGKRQLLHRVKRIMEINNNANFNYGQRLLALLSTTCVIFCIAWLSPKSEQQKKQKVSKSYTTTLIRHANKIDNVQSLTVNHSEHPLKNLPVKPSSKKVFVNLNKNLKLPGKPIQTELAQSELDIDQKNKKISSKEDDEFNQFLAVSEGLNQSLFFNKEKILAQVKEAIANVEKGQHVTMHINLKKVQANLDKNYFSFSFDNKKIPNAFNLAKKNKELQILIHRQQDFQDEDQWDLESKNRSIPEIKNAGEKKLQRLKILKDCIDKSNSPKLLSPSKNNVKIDYRHGFIFINGEKIVLPDTKQMLAKISINGKKIFSPDDEINIKINN